MGRGNWCKLLVPGNPKGVWGSGSGVRGPGSGVRGPVSEVRDSYMLHMLVYFSEVSLCVDGTN